MQNLTRIHFSSLLMVIGAMIVLGGGSQLALAAVLKFAYPNSANPILEIPTHIQIIANAVVSILMFYVPVALIDRLHYSKNLPQLWKLHNKPNTTAVAIGISVLMLGAAFLGFLQEWMQNLEFSKQFSATDAITQDAYKKLLQIDSIPKLLISLIGISFIPALVEEIVFRGFFQRIFIDLTHSPILGILIAAIVFSAIHLQFVQFPIRVILGIVLGLLFYVTQSLWTPIIVHAFNNGFIVIQAYILTSSGVKPEEVLESTHFEWYWVALSALALVLACCFLYIKKEIFNVESHSKSNLD